MQTDTDRKPTQNTTQWAEKTSFTLVEAAAFLEVRADDLTTILPSAGIDLGTRQNGLLTHDDVERREGLVSDIRRISKGSVVWLGESVDSQHLILIPAIAQPRI